MVVGVIEGTSRGSPHDGLQSTHVGELSVLVLFPLKHQPARIGNAGLTMLSGVECSQGGCRVGYHSQTHPSGVSLVVFGLDRKFEWARRKLALFVPPAGER
jgi:hypothetical protein